MNKGIAGIVRRSLERNGIGIALFAGLFVVPLLLHALARQLA